jgi:hypothetical protein
MIPARGRAETSARCYDACRWRGGASFLTQNIRSISQVLVFEGLYLKTCRPSPKWLIYLRFSTVPI